GKPGLLLPAVQREEGRQEPGADLDAAAPRAAAPALRAVHQPDQVRRRAEKRGVADVPARCARIAGLTRCWVLGVRYWALGSRTEHPTPNTQHPDSAPNFRRAFLHHE